MPEPAPSALMAFDVAEVVVLMNGAHCSKLKTQHVERVISFQIIEQGQLRHLAEAALCGF